MHRMSWFGSAVIALALSEQLSGTCTVVIAARDFGILAADCVDARQDGSSSSAACKIRAGNGLAVTLAGMVADGATGLDLMSLGSAAMAESASPQEAADRFAAMAIRDIARSLERQRAGARELWQKRLGREIARAAFAGIERGRPVIVVRTIGVSPEGLVKDLGSQTIVSQATPSILVYCEKAAELMSSNASWKSLDPGRLAYELIRAAAAPGANPIYVTVIRVGKSGVKWLDRGACSELTY